MGRILLSVWALLAGMGMLYLGNGMLGTLLGLRLAATELPTWIVGLVMSFYFLGLVFGTIFAYRLISGVGHIRAFAALASIFSAATLAHAFHLDPWYWAGLRFVEGMCVAGLVMCTESWLNERTANDVRGQVFSLYLIAIYVAQGGGQVMLNIPDPTGFGLFVVASILVSLALVPVAVARVQAPPLPKPFRYGFLELYAISPLGMLGAFSSGLILGAFYGMAPYFARQAGPRRVRDDRVHGSRHRRRGGAPMAHRAAVRPLRPAPGHHLAGRRHHRHKLCHGGGDGV